MDQAAGVEHAHSHPEWCPCGHPGGNGDLTAAASLPRTQAWTCVHLTGGDLLLVTPWRQAVLLSEMASTGCTTAVAGVHAELLVGPRTTLDFHV